MRERDSSESHRISTVTCRKIDVKHDTHKKIKIKNEATKNKKKICVPLRDSDVSYNKMARGGGGGISISFV
jgi:hypothetical protein